MSTPLTTIPLGALLARPSLQAKTFAKRSGADDATVRAELEHLPETLAEVERLRADGVIGGDSANAADFQIAGTLRSLETIGELRPYLDDHPAMEWARTRLPALPGPSPTALPPEWLAPLRS